jgi:hypothetical protein
MAEKLDIGVHLEEYQTAQDGWRDIYDEALDDILFASGEGQWPADIKAERMEDGRPTLIINKLWKFIKSVQGDQKQNRPEIKVFPVDSKADTAVAEILQDVIRHIEHKSNAKSVYDTGFNQCLTSSIGFWRVVSQYVEGESFDQELRIERVRNQFRVLFDPKAKDPNYTDAEYVYIFDYIPKDEFEKMYPDASTGSFPGDANTQAYEEWFEDNRIRIAEKFYKTKVSKKIVELSDGTVITLEGGITKDILEEQGFQITRERKAEFTEIKWVKMNGNEILEGPIDWPGKFLPVVAIPGDELDIQGKNRLFSLIRHAKDPQMMYNFWRTAATEMVALQPKAPYMVTPTQIAGFERHWDVAGNKNQPYLPFNSDPLNPGPPKRVAPPSIPTGALSETDRADGELYDTIGITPPALGMQSNERSGKALAMRQRSADKTVFSFFDSHSNAIAHTGRILVDLIPHFYDTKRVIKIMGDDAKLKELVINNEYYDETNLEFVIENDLTDAGEYDVVLSSGPSYETKRQQQLEMLMQFVQFAPQTAPILYPLVAKNMDVPGADDLAELMMITLPPEIQQAYGMIPNTQGGQGAVAQNQLPSPNQGVPQPAEAV